MSYYLNIYQFIIESIKIVEYEVQNSFILIIKFLNNQEKVRLKDQINIEKNKLSYQIKLTSVQIRDFIQNIISIIIQVTFSTSEIIEKLFRILEEIQEILLRMEILIDSNRNLIAHFNISLAFQQKFLKLVVEWSLENQF
ncbi:unnamed protein product [Paramecium octaurelia]|uniref:Uncharacterized protein n=1 Tax=Paramecium octaurelia TaxID=43137 RepID=A0A8S1T1U5_PAROT|nr:unnamed protein product [Paramecium octaurelia]